MKEILAATLLNYLRAAPDAAFTSRHLGNHHGLTERQAVDTLSYLHKHKLIHIAALHPRYPRKKFWSSGNYPDAVLQVKDQEASARRKKRKYEPWFTVTLPLLPASMQQLKSKTGLQKSGVYYHLTKLRAVGLVRLRGNCTWGLTDKGADFMDKVKKQKEQQHAQQ